MSPLTPFEVRTRHALVEVLAELSCYRDSEPTREAQLHNQLIAMVEAARCLGGENLVAAISKHFAQVLRKRPGDCRHGFPFKTYGKPRTDPAMCTLCIAPSRNPGILDTGSF